MADQNQSTWLADRPKKKTYPSLSESVATDVIIAGGGITGILSAYLLSKQGKDVVLLESSEIGSGATGVTTGFLSEIIDTDNRDLIKSFGLERAKEIIKSHQEAIDLVERIVQEHKIDCDFRRCSDYIFANEEKDAQTLKEECKGARELGIAAEFYAGGMALGFKNHGYIEIKNQAMFHPLKFLDAVAEIVTAQGVRIFEHTKVDDIQYKNNRISVQAGQYHVNGDWAISATYEPLGEPTRLYFKKGMYVSYIFEIEVSGMELVEGLYEDTLNPYHYFRIEKRGNTNRVIIGGEDHRQDLHTDEVKSFNALKQYVDTIFPDSSYIVRRMWKGGVLEPIDGIPLIGAMNDEPILYAAAFSGNGMTYGAIAAELFAQQVVGKNNIRHEIFSPKRMPGFQALMYKGRDYAEEMVGGAIKNTFTQSKEPDKKLALVKNRLP